MTSLKSEIEEAEQIDTRDDAWLSYWANPPDNDIKREENHEPDLQIIKTESQENDTKTTLVKQEAESDLNSDTSDNWLCHWANPPNADIKKEEDIQPALTTIKTEYKENEQRAIDTKPLDDDKRRKLTRSRADQIKITGQ